MTAAPRTEPVGRPFLTAEWRYLVMFNFRVPSDTLAEYVPAGTVLDTWCGDTWLSLVGFRFLQTRVLGIPVPCHRDFPEVNLRFYVRPVTDDRRAVVFLREIVPRRAIAVTARRIYNEPYVSRRMRVEAPMRESESPGRVSYGWRHAGRWNSIGVTAVGGPTLIQHGSAEEFFAEHYWGYTAQRDGSTVEYQVEHPTWRVWTVTDATFDVDVAAEYGAAFAPLLAGPPASVFLADGSAIRVGRPRRLWARTSRRLGLLCIALGLRGAAAQTPAPTCGVRGSPQWLATRPSPLDSATVTIHGAIAKICYSRPSARGRSVDSLVPPRLAWRTGANEPTTLTLTARLNIGGAILSPGRYVILTVPNAEQWILVFHTTPDSEPARMFQSLRQVASGTGQVERLSQPIEQFTIRPAPDGVEPAFTLEWGDWRIRVPVRSVP